MKFRRRISAICHTHLAEILTNSDNSDSRVFKQSVQIISQICKFENGIKALRPLVAVLFVCRVGSFEMRYAKPRCSPYSELDSRLCLRKIFEI